MVPIIHSVVNGEGLMDEIDRLILRELQRDATTPFARLAEVVGLSAASTHERVRKLRARGVIVRTGIEVDPAALGQDVLAFVSLSSDAWVGDPPTRERLASIPEVEAAYVVAGDSSLLVKIRTTTNERLQRVLRDLYTLDGITGTRSTVVLETFFERPVAVTDGS
jgi:Lrp/AsnC family transcriptional regulator, leucine-responsive regulatory protein